MEGSVAVTENRSMAKRVTPRFKAEKPRFFFKEWRKFRGKTQEELGDMIGMTPSSISQLETGKQGFTDSTLTAIAEALNCEPGDLLMRNPLDTEAPWTIWENIKPERRPQALDVLKTFQEQYAMTGTDGLRLRPIDSEDLEGPGIAAPVRAGQPREAKRK